jgi:hypothetical protein
MTEGRIYPGGIAALNRELRRERQDLVRADRDICEGEQRIFEQQERMSALRRRGSAIDPAERLLRLMGETLHQWQVHRRLIIDRIHYLEASVLEAGRPEAGPAAPPAAASSKGNAATRTPPM